MKRLMTGIMAAGVGTLGLGGLAAMPAGATQVATSIDVHALSTGATLDVPTAAAASIDVPALAGMTLDLPAVLDQIRASIDLPALGAGMTLGTPAKESENCDEES